MEHNAQGQVDYMCSEIARALRLPEGSPSDTVEHVRNLWAWTEAHQSEHCNLKVSDSWQPIETAPRDGTEVLVYTRNRAGLPGIVAAHYMQGGHCIEDHPPIDRGWYYWTGSIMDITAATHWMPLPSAPLPRTEGSR